MKSLNIFIIGGGAAGVMSAICAARAGHRITLCERLKQPGKKVLASGGGRCNFTNAQIGPEDFHEAEYDFVRKVLDRFGKKEIDQFFTELGLYSYTAEDGRVFPISNRSQTVMDVLKNEMKRLQVKVELECDIKKIQKKEKSFELTNQTGKKYLADRVVLCSGGKSYPALGSDGHGYNMARSFGHRIIEPVPITLPIVVKDRWCHFLQGQKVKGRAAARVDGKLYDFIEGDILFTQYGLSGTAIFDCTDPISIALHRGLSKNTAVVIDLVPFMNEEELYKEFERKLSHGFPPETLIDGILSPKFLLVLKDYLKREKTRELAHLLKNREFKVDATKGWNEAEFTAGGVSIEEVHVNTLESKKQKGFYFAGEILNVQGRRGGFNLAWAWATGAILGKEIQ